MPPSDASPTRLNGKRGSLTASVIIPAYNEGAAIGDVLSALTSDGASDLDIVVVCNGCLDDTAEIARGFAPKVRVIETSVASKSNALNLGDEAALTYPRVYQDGDIVMSADSVRRMARALEAPGILAAAPAPINVFDPGTHWIVGVYYRFWMALPYIQEGMVAGGVYALSEAGRKRFGKFPDIIADDGFVRLQFTAGERVLAPGATSRVVVPATWNDLIKTRTRSRLGVMQLRARYPELFARERDTKGYGGALRTVVAHPRAYPATLAYLAVSILSLLRARRQARRLESYVWERDDSARARSVERAA